MEACSSALRSLLLLAALSAVAAAEEPKSPAAAAASAAKRVTWAFSDGVAPPAEEAREARRVVEEYVRGLEPAARAKAHFMGEGADQVLAKAAWAAGDRDAARTRAEAILARLDDIERWDRGNVLHHMKILLGRLALEAGDVDAAARLLLEAGATPGSPQLDTFGPDWSLARDLLAKGRRDEVLAYMDRVETFWESGREKLAAWRKTLKEGGTPPLAPIRKARTKDAEPPPSAPSAGPAKDLPGLWESVGKSQGGIGSAMTFEKDGRVRSRMVVLVDAKWRVEGDQLIATFGDDAQPMPLGKFEGDAWTIEAEGMKIAKRRVGAATPNAPPVVGVWSYRHYTEATALERYDADGWMRLRVLMAGLTTGTWARDGKTLTMTFDGKAQVYDATLDGDRLKLVAKADGKELEYRYAGEAPWYDLAAGE